VSEVPEMTSWLLPQITCFGRVWPGRLRNVRLAALDLKEISWVDLGSGLHPGILGFPCFHLEINVFLTFHLNVTSLCKLRRIRVLGCTVEFMTITIPGIGVTSR